MVTCECGAPAAIHKTGECKRCYNARHYRERHTPRPPRAPITEEERKARARAYYLANRDRKAAQGKAWKQANPDAIAEQKRRARERHGDEINERRREQYAEQAGQRAEQREEQDRDRQRLPRW